MSSDKNILVIGALGQIGTDLVKALVNRYGHERIVAADLREPEKDSICTFVKADVMDPEGLESIVRKHNIDEIYHLAALLSATAEANPMFGWELNMKGLFNVLEMAREKIISKIFWPSSIAVFGPTTPKQMTPQYTVMEPTTVYGISKLAGERWCQYYHDRYGVDVRGVRYPGLISYMAPPGGGTTDYAVEIFHEARKNNAYCCFLQKDTELPMMFMDDAIHATIGIMEAPAEQVKIRSSYNVTGFSFTPQQLATLIQERSSGFKMSYQPDFRQSIADSWPDSIDDSVARDHWGWKPETDLGTMVDIMLKSV